MKEIIVVNWKESAISAIIKQFYVYVVASLMVFLFSI